MPTIYLGLGTNLGDRESNLREALRRLAELVRIEAVSSVYESEPVGFRAQPDFWNLVVRGQTELGPRALLGAIQEIERMMGRRPSFRNAPRVIDIDILLYDDVELDLPELSIPHPRMLERAFVLRPLAELAPGLVYPRTGRTIAEHLRSATGLERAEPLFPGARLLDPRSEAG
ncbi:MAG TPA: 2-amino-4-hydroxy-6-hydroxymethyldihydropteridine diphosphokinase [Longimicrobiales bacterium]